MKTLKLTLVIAAMTVGIIGATSLTRVTQTVEAVPVTWDVECEYAGDDQNELTKRTCKAPGTYNYCPYCP